MTNKAYDTIKLISLFGAPILVFISAIVSIWNVPYMTQITASLAALDSLLGAFVIVAKKIYDNKEEKGNE